MSLKVKLTSAIIAFVLLASMLIVGVFAVKQTNFSVGGNIVFNASGINATISAGTMAGGTYVTGSAETKMKSVSINTEKSASQLAEEYETWSGLDLEFNESGDDVTITFTITNNSTNADDSLVAYVNIDSGTSKNAVAYVENAGAVIAPNTTEATDENVETFVITFHILDKEVNASLEGFKIDFDIRYATVTAESSTDTTLSYEGITYTVGENNTVSLTGYTIDPVNLVVPAYIKNGETTYAVTSIGANVFRSCTSLTSISIPSSVTSIANYVFWGCSDLTNISIPTSVTSIGNHAFRECAGLTNIIIPSGVTSIGNYVFYDCSGLTSIVIPNSVETIGNATFYGCAGLTSIEIPSSVLSIGNVTFQGCSSLTSIIIPAGVTSIGTSFVDCSGLETIVVEEGNTVYDSRENCNAIIETSSNTLIWGCKNTIIPNSITRIDGVAFYGSGLKSIVIPTGVTSIGEEAFAACTNLTTVLIDSPTIAGALSGTGSSVCGGLIASASTIYVKTDIVSSLNSFVTTNYTNVETITSGEYAGYTCYSK